MDPLTIAAACGGLTGTLITLIKTVGAFVSTARNSRSDLENVSRELISLQICLEVLENDRRDGVLLGSDLDKYLHQILVNVQICCGQIETMLHKLKSSRFGRPIKWATQQKDEVNQYRSSLESHKTALQMTLQLNTISIIAREEKSQARLRVSQREQADRTNSALEEINQKLDRVTLAQAPSPALQRMDEALSELSLSMRDVALHHSELRELAQASSAFAAEAARTSSSSAETGSLEIGLLAMLDDPFDDQHQANEVPTRMTASLPKAAPSNFSGNNQICPVCSTPQTPAERDNVMAEMQRLEATWRQEWLTQLKKEILVQERRSSDHHSKHTEERLPSNSEFESKDDMTDLISEILSFTSWNDSESYRNLSEIRSIASSRTTTRSSTASEIQRLRVRYTSACERVTMLNEEVLDLENENVKLQELHRRDIARLKARLVRADSMSSSQAEAALAENEDLHQRLDACEKKLRQSEEQIQNHRSNTALLGEQLKRSGEARRADVLRADAALGENMKLRQDLDLCKNEMRRSEDRIRTYQSDVLSVRDQLESLRKAHAKAEQDLRQQGVDSAEVIQYLHKKHGLTKKDVMNIVQGNGDFFQRERESLLSDIEKLRKKADETLRLSNSPALKGLPNFIPATPMVGRFSITGPGANLLQHRALWSRASGFTLFDVHLRAGRSSTTHESYYSRLQFTPQDKFYDYIAPECLPEGAERLTFVDGPFAIKDPQHPDMVEYGEARELSYGNLLNSHWRNHIPLEPSPSFTSALHEAYRRCLESVVSRVMFTRSPKPIVYEGSYSGPSFTSGTPSDLAHNLEMTFRIEWTATAIKEWLREQLQANADG